MADDVEQAAGAAFAARVDLHCHSSFSFDGVADPAALVARARDRGLTHIAITDHDTIAGAVQAAAEAPREIRVIVGSEVLTTEGDLVFLFLSEAIPRGLAARDAIAAGREQGAMVGIPHPYDRSRRSLLRDPANVRLVPLVDWVEVRNGRVAVPAVDAQAARLAARTGMPGIGASDAHTLLEVGTVLTLMDGDPSTPEGLAAALRSPLGIAGDDGPGTSPAPAGLRRFFPGRLLGGTSRQ